MRSLDLRAAPNVPGVYFMLGPDGEILYIGKAKRLRKRLASYRCVKPSTHPPHLVELVSRIRSIRWEVFRTEKLARSREHELLHAIRPPYNTADTEPGSYLFVTARRVPGREETELKLTSEPEEGRAVFGCYRNRSKTRRGFEALLRLIFAASFKGSRFSMPARLMKPKLSAPYRVRLELSRSADLSRFLRGESLRFLRRLSLELIENEAVPRFMGPSLQDDLDLAREFFRAGPRATRLLKRRGHFRAGVLLHDQMDELVRLSLPSFTSGQELNRAKS